MHTHTHTLLHLHILTRHFNVVLIINILFCSCLTVFNIFFVYQISISLSDAYTPNSIILPMTIQSFSPFVLFIYIMTYAYLSFFLLISTFLSFFICVYFNYVSYSYFSIKCIRSVHIYYLSLNFVSISVCSYICLYLYVYPKFISIL